MDHDFRPDMTRGLKAPELFRNHVPGSVQLDGTLPGMENVYRTFILPTPGGYVTGIRIPLDELPYIAKEPLERHLRLIAAQWSAEAVIIDHDSKTAFIEFHSSPQSFPAGTDHQFARQQELLCAAVRNFFTGLIGPVRQMDASTLYGENYPIADGFGDLASIKAGLKTRAFEDLNGLPLQYEEINGAGIVIKTKLRPDDSAGAELLSFISKNHLNAGFFEAGGDNYVNVWTDFTSGPSERSARWNLRLFVSCHLAKLSGES